MSNYVGADEGFFLYLLNYIYNVHTAEKDSFAVKQYSGFCFVNLVKNKNLSDRTIVPTVRQVKSVLVG